MALLHATFLASSLIGVMAASPAFAKPEATTASAFKIPEVGMDDWTPITANDEEGKKAQFDRDFRFYLATLFPNPDKIKEMQSALAMNPTLSKKDKDTFLATYLEGQRRIKMLSRVFVAMAYGGLQYRKEGASSLEDWPNQMATALAHGLRVLFHCKGFSSYDLYTLLGTGTVQSTLKDPYTDPDWRLSSTHDLGWDKQGNLQELAHTGLGKAKGVLDGLLGHQHGVDMPLGGIGNPWMDGTYLVGPVGMGIDPKTFIPSKDREHGHLLLFHRDLPDPKDKTKVLEGGLLVGMETAGFGKQNMFNYKHTISSDAKGALKTASVFGGQKMQVLLGKDSPAALGGMVVSLSRDDFKILQKLVRSVDNLGYTSKKVALFTDLLKQDARDAKASINAFYKEAAKALDSR